MWTFSKASDVQGGGSGRSSQSASDHAISHSGPTQPSMCSMRQSTLSYKIGFVWDGLAHLWAHVSAVSTPRQALLSRGGGGKSGLLHAF